MIQQIDPAVYAKAQEDTAQLVHRLEAQVTINGPLILPLELEHDLNLFLAQFPANSAEWLLARIMFLYEYRMEPGWLKDPGYIVEGASKVVAAITSQMDLERAAKLQTLRNLMGQNLLPYNLAAEIWEIIVF
jgi:hypothetical protein